MCLLVLALDAVPGFRVVLAANRDEFHGRPTAAADFWPDAPWVLAGRDLEGGGTWLGVTRSGRAAAVTNFREPGRQVPEAPSRGRLVADYLRGSEGPEEWARHAYAHGGRWNGFNLVVGDLEGWWYCSNRGSEPRPLGAGIHGLSNHLLDTPWPKVVRVRERLASLAASGRPVTTEQVLEMLDDRQQAPDGQLPDTGVGLAWERVLSAPFIATPDYGTRSSTAILVDARGELAFSEQSHAADGTPAARRDHVFTVDAAAAGARS